MSERTKDAETQSGELERLRAIVTRHHNGSMAIVLKTMHVPTIVELSRFHVKLNADGHAAMFMATQDGWGFLVIGGTDEADDDGKQHTVQCGVCGAAREAGFPKMRLLCATCNRYTEHAESPQRRPPEPDRDAHEPVRTDVH